MAFGHFQLYSRNALSGWLCYLSIVESIGKFRVPVGATQNSYSVFLRG